MMKQKLFKYLFGAVAGMLFTPVAMAVCSPSSLTIYGTCGFVPYSVSCNNLFAVGIGSVQNSAKYMTCTISSQTPPQAIPGVLFCANKGGKVAPGVNSFANNGFAGTAQVYQSQIDSNGIAHGIDVHAEDTEILAALNQYCQNPNWTAIDFVPSLMNATVAVTDDTGATLQSATFACSLPDPTTLAWDQTANRPEQRPYNCTLINSSN